MLKQFLPTGHYVSSAEIYDWREMNVFVRSSPAVPAVGFIRIRRKEQHGSADH